MKIQTLRNMTVATLIMSSLVSCGINARIKKADKRYEIGEYYAAGEMYRSIYGKLGYKDPRRADIAFKQGECYRRLNHPRTAAVYQNAVRGRNADTTAYLRQAQSLHFQAKYADAVKAYDTYLKRRPTDSVAIEGRWAARHASEWRKAPTRYKVVADKDLNERRSSSFCPVYIGSSTDAVMFTSNRRERSARVQKNSSITGVPPNHLWQMRRNASGKWEEAALVEGVNTDADEGVCTFTSDGSTMYFSRGLAVNGSDHGAAIFSSSRSGGTWAEPQYVELFKDSTITVAHPTISADGQTMYFVSDAPGGVGGLDLWKAERIDGSWLVENLGRPINTEDDEMFPYLRSNGELYFASRGHAGFGGLDLFKAVMNADSTAYEVLNLGWPINSAGDDFGITFAPDKEEGFFSSNRNQKRFVDQIYSFQLPELVCEVHGRITDTDGDVLADGFVRLVGDDGTNARVLTRKDGTYRFRLQPGVRYAMLGGARGHLNQSERFSTEGLTADRTIEQNFQLTPVSRPVTMDNIFYEFGRWDLTKESETELQKLVKLLNDNPNITIELSAHTDSVGSAEANRVLSERRAKSVMDFLIRNGIEHARLTAVGYGEERPVTVDAALHRRYPYLPIGQQLTPDFIATLAPDEQSVANQVNRRTEFKVTGTTYNLY
ncbi:MAG: OmpA family protein [Paludibacteraceae bacterium]|nr:OmpA family protein [Paludibacteraceae bacterium]